MEGFTKVDLGKKSRHGNYLSLLNNFQTIRISLLSDTGFVGGRCDLHISDDGLRMALLDSERGDAKIRHANNGSYYIHSTYIGKAINSHFNNKRYNVEICEHGVIFYPIEQTKMVA